MEEIIRKIKQEQALHSQRQVHSKQDSTTQIQEHRRTHTTYVTKNQTE